MSNTWVCFEQMRKPGKGPGSFENCRGMSLSMKTGNMTFCDINNKRIQVLSEEGKFLHSWRTEVNGSGLCPLDAFRYDDNTLACAMEGHATLWHFPDTEDPSKEEIRLKHSFGNDHLVFPRSIVRNEAGQIFVSDVGRHCVNMYDQNGTFIKSHGSLGAEDAVHFNWPYYQCVDDRGRLAVADSHNRCVKLFDAASLQYLGRFGTDDNFTCVTGIVHSTSGGGFFHANDYDNCQMLTFSADGRFVEFVDEQMPTTGSDVDLDRHGNIVVTVFDGFLKYKIQCG